MSRVVFILDRRRCVNGCINNGRINNGRINNGRGNNGRVNDGRVNGCGGEYLLLFLLHDRRRRSGGRGGANGGGRNHGRHRGVAAQVACEKTKFETGFSIYSFKGSNQALSSYGFNWIQLVQPHQGVVVVGREHRDVVVQVEFESKFGNQ